LLNTPATEETGSAVPEPVALSEQRVLRLLLVTVSVALVWILLPFYGSVLWGAIIAVLFKPLYHWLLPRLRERRSLAALLTIMAATLIVVLPAVLLSSALVREARHVFELVESGELQPAQWLRGLFDALPSWITSLLGQFGLADFDTVQNELAAALSRGTQFIATQTFTVGQNALSLLVSLFIALYLAFFLVRDGDTLIRAVHRAIPLAPGDRQALLKEFGTVLRATVKGNLVIAVVQGALGGLAFWVLGVRGALLWAALMGVLSLLPVVGASLVWVPLAIYLFVTGSPWEAVGLVAFGVLVIGLVDNVLRPILIGHDTGLPDYLVMITTFGGIALLGINGFVIGPTVAAMFIAVWHIQTETRFAPPPETKKTLATGSASPVAPCAAAQTRAENARQT
jgi:predicted PurR-regulated permease PerM